MAATKPAAKASAKTEDEDPAVEIDHADQVAKNGPHAPGQCVTCDQLAKGDSTQA